MFFSLPSRSRFAASPETARCERAISPSTRPAFPSRPSRPARRPRRAGCRRRAPWLLVFELRGAPVDARVGRQDGQLFLARLAVDRRGRDLLAFQSAFLGRRWRWVRQSSPRADPPAVPVAMPLLWCSGRPPRRVCVRALRRSVGPGRWLSIIQAECTRRGQSLGSRESRRGSRASHWRDGSRFISLARSQQNKTVED